jgi:hypothetical protein
MRRVRRKPSKKPRRFALVDLEEIEAPQENPDWLVGSN